MDPCNAKCVVGTLLALWVRGKKGDKRKGDLGKKFRFLTSLTLCDSRYDKIFSPRNYVRVLTRFEPAHFEPLGTTNHGSSSNPPKYTE